MSDPIAIPTEAPVEGVDNKVRNDSEDAMLCVMAQGPVLSIGIVWKKYWIVCVHHLGNCLTK